MTERRRRRPSARLRILGWYVVMLVLAAAAALLLQRRVLQEQFDDEVEEGLAQETAELRELAAGRDPETGEPFGTDIRALFDTFLRRNIPLDDEAFATYVAGEPYRGTQAPHALLDDAELTRRWATIAETARGDLTTPAGPVRFLAVPIELSGRTRGVFVVTHFLEDGRAAIDRTVRVGATVWGSILLVTTVAAWGVAGRVLAPVRLLTGTAREITGSDLSRRIPVEGDDEIAELAATFNAMLDRLQAAFDSQRAFLDDAGHELRTPITIVRGHLELLGDDPDERRETVALVTDELDRMARMVEELLVLARAEQADFLRVEPVDLDLLTRELATKAPALGDRAWNVEATGHGVVVADRQRLTQAAMNLIDNAIRHTDAGDPIGVGSALKDGEARLWVRDSGPGVAVDDQDRIFGRFTRLDGGRRRGGAAGLGLAIVRTIAEAHGGRVEVDSEPGRGACFTLVIPARDEGD